jgi:protein-S-isoprenylcysteine O-methyltransferase Ste14
MRRSVTNGMAAVARAQWLRHPSLEPAMETRIPPPLLALALAALAWGLDRWVPQARLVFPFQAELAVVLLALGFSCMLSGVVAFGRAKTTVDPLHPDRASQLVVAGIYRRSRNPMYLGMLVLLGAWSVFLGQPLALLVMPLWVGYIARFQIEPEEAALRRLFGASYAAYCSKVRRWI